MRELGVSESGLPQVPAGVWGPELLGIIDRLSTARAGLADFFCKRARS